MSAVTIIDRSEALQQAAKSLGLESQGHTTITRSMLAQSLRRAVFNAAPIAAHALRELVVAALEPLADNTETLKMEIEETLRDVIAMGDILEMRTDFSGRSDIVLRPAPPAFIERRDGTFVIIGISGDEITPDLETPIIHHARGLRSARSAHSQTCRAELLNLGLIEIPERLWLHAPAVLDATDFVALWKARLPTEFNSEKIEDLELLDTALPTSFYKGRWVTIRANHTGLFVARRRQRFGSRLWSLVDVKDGIVQRLTDIRTNDSRARDCDEAWRLQAAMDAAAGAPQKVMVFENGLTSILAFQGPLPSWAARRLSFIGEQVIMPRALLAFKISTDNVDDELRWLGDNLWLTRADGREV